ncbi:hypothetical protein Sango_1895700 [Sesamum angolense]|uniref:DUF4283 domain-containing protein n=1 Tax=Sesamum angolense TaxID=2727404 RepID=A0AAE2BQP6_9LAMI|nr:hypothetical protein Sango_1895700 [Sesamum angolense]
MASFTFNPADFPPLTRANPAESNSAKTASFRTNQPSEIASPHSANNIPTPHHSDFCKFFLANSKPPSIGATKEINGRPTIIFSDSETQSLVANFRLALIGKFSQGIPPYSQLHWLLAKSGIKGAFTVSLINNKHALISLSNESDFTRLWLRRIWYLNGFPMRIFKWSPTFNPNHESSIVPIWVSLPEPFESTDNAIMHVDADDNSVNIAENEITIAENSISTAENSTAENENVKGDVVCNVEYVASGKGNENGLHVVDIDASISVGDDDVNAIHCVENAKVIEETETFERDEAFMGKQVQPENEIDENALNKGEKTVGIITTRPNHIIGDLWRGKKWITAENAVSLMQNLKRFGVVIKSIKEDVDKNIKRNKLAESNSTRGSLPRRNRHQLHHVRDVVRKGKSWVHWCGRGFGLQLSLAWLWAGRVFRLRLSWTGQMWAGALMGPGLVAGAWAAGRLAGSGLGKNWLGYWAGSALDVSVGLLGCWAEGWCNGRALGCCCWIVMSRQDGPSCWAEEPRLSG